MAARGARLGHLPSRPDLAVGTVSRRDLHGDEDQEEPSDMTRLLDLIFRFRLWAGCEPNSVIDWQRCQRHDGTLTVL